VTMEKAMERIPGFNGLSRDETEKILSISILKKARKKEIIFSDGEVGEGFFAVLRGRVRVYKMSEEGREVILHVCGPGDHFGQVSMFAGKNYPAWAQAMSDSKLLLFPRRAFLDLLSREPQIAMSMMSGLSSKMRELTLQVESLALKEVPGRLASYLIMLAEEKKSPGSLHLDIPKWQLASVLGTTPETLSRIFSDMTDRGLIDLDRRDVTLLDHTALKELAEHGRFYDVRTPKK